MIVSDLEGTLTENTSFWKNLNLEMGMTEAEDLLLYEEFMGHRNYTKWMEKIISRWKEINQHSPSRLHKATFNKFNKKHLIVKEGAKNFIQHCKLKYFFYVISGAPVEFCKLAQQKLGFDDFFSTNELIFDQEGQLDRIKPHPDGFHKEKIISNLSFRREQIIAIGDSENDFTMLNAAGLGILVGNNIIFSSYERKTLNSNIIRMQTIDYEKLKHIIDHFLP